MGFKKDVWELYNLNEDYSQANNWQQKNPEKWKELKKLFSEEAKENKDCPLVQVSGSGFIRKTPSHRHIKAGYSTEIQTECLNSVLPDWVKRSNKVVVDMEVPANANGVLYAMGGGSGGLTCFMENGKLVYEYNMMIIERYTVEAKEKLSPGKHTR